MIQRCGDGEGRVGVELGFDEGFDERERGFEDEEGLGLGCDSHEMVGRESARAQMRVKGGPSKRATDVRSAKGRSSSSWLLRGRDGWLG